MRSALKQETVPLSPRWSGLVLASVLAIAPAARAGSNSLLSLSPDGRILLAANADNDSVSVLDTSNRRLLREIAVGKRPESVAIVAAGPLAVVTAYKEDQLVLIDFEKGQVVARIDTPDEPYGVVVNDSGTRAYVTHEYPGVVSEIDLPSRRVLRQIPVGPFLRGIALDAAQKRLYVTEFFTGILHAVSLDSGTVVDSWAGSPSDNLARHVALHPSRPAAYVSHIRSRTEVAHGEGSIFPYLAVIDLRPGEARRRRAIATDTYNGVLVVSNPWEAAISPDAKRIYTINSGTNDMNVSNLLDDGYREIQRVGSLVRLGSNPRAVVVSPDSRTVYIYNVLDFAIQVFDAVALRTAGTIKTCDPPYSVSHQRGKILFNAAVQPMSGRRWISCSSCHPDGQHDARTWQNPEGLRNTTGFMAMKYTFPLHWSADRDETQDFEITIRGPLMQGRGLAPGRVHDGLKEPNAGLSADLDALAEYCDSFLPPLSPHASGGKLSPAAERGRLLFASDAVGCATCHRGPYYTDSSLTKPFTLHDVGTCGDDPSEKVGTKFDTPTLLGIYRTAPYLHDGKAKTLREVLVECNRKDQHGRTSQLKPAQIDDLVEFLKSLPYEAMPAEVGPRKAAAGAGTPPATSRQIRNGG
jgi:YVTN family beta-propeller protein